MQFLFTLLQIESNIVLSPIPDPKNIVLGYHTS